MQLIVFLPSKCIQRIFLKYVIPAVSKERMILHHNLERIMKEGAVNYFMVSV
jgi:hypothetical protein